jgi:hypothetical protein
MNEEIRRKILTLLDQDRIMTIATLRPDGWPYNALGVSIAAAGVRYPFFGILLSPLIAAAAMSLSSVSVVSKALRLRGA